MMYKILVGTLKNELGTFQKGDTVDLTDTQAQNIDPRCIQKIDVASQPIIEPVKTVEAPKIASEPVVETKKAAATAKTAEWGASKK